MLAHKIEDKRSSVVFPGYVQPKLDGVRCILTDDGFYSRSGKKILGVPELEVLTINAFNDIPLDGELYSTSMTFQQIVASVRRTKNVAEDIRVKYHVYDVATNELYSMREERLSTDMYPNRVVRVSTYKVLNWPELEARMEQFLIEGYEGLMYRHPTAPYQFGKRSKYLLKYKHMKTEDATCIGYKEGKGKHEGMLGALQCVCEDDSVVWVGTGFDDAQRYTYWQRRIMLIDRILTIKYQEKTDGGVSRFPVFVAWRDYE